MNTPYKMKGKSPMMKALIGKQGNLPAELKAKILASPTKMYGKKSPAKAERVGSDQEVMTKKKSTDAVVDRKGIISSVGTERLIAAGAPPEVIAKSKAKFIKEQKKKSSMKMMKKSPAKNYKKGYYGA